MYFRLAARATLLFLLFFALGCSEGFRQSGAQAETIRVQRVIDGDTIELDTGERIRLIGVDTPEMKDKRPAVKELARAATSFVRQLVEGKPVSLEYDRAPRDRWERTLAYVYLEDGTFLNAEIIRQGYGLTCKRHSFRFRGQFRRLEREAQQNGRGLWSDGPPARPRC